MALTDHDTFSGLPEFIDAAKDSDIVAFPGIEITVQYRDFNLHLLSYFKSLDSILPDLWNRVETMKEARENRMHQLIGKINEVIPDHFR
jgi:predicted metal-dependent phosphoesterase TrpH